jgi:hypothetical protein
MPKQSLPDEVVNACLYWERELNWPECVPTYAEIPDHDGYVRWKEYESLTVADCEQAVENYSRLARKKLERAERRNSRRIVTGMSRRTARQVGRMIIWARVFRCRYISLTGQNEATEEDMPFPDLTWEPTFAG